MSVKYQPVNHITFDGPYPHARFHFVEYFETVDLRRDLPQHPLVKKYSKLCDQLADIGFKIEEAILLGKIEAVTDIEDPSADPHIGCPSYPNCGEAPLGCIIEMGDNVEWYGMR